MARAVFSSAPLSGGSPWRRVRGGLFYCWPTLLLVNYISTRFFFWSSQTHQHRTAMYRGSSILNVLAVATSAVLPPKPLYRSEDNRRERLIWSRFLHAS
jgi:hypothetical protein